MYACVLSHFGCIWLCNPIDPLAHQGPLSMEFCRQEYWSGLSCPLPGDLPDPSIELKSLMSCVLAGRFFTTSTTWEGLCFVYFATIFFKIVFKNTWRENLSFYWVSYLPVCGPYCTFPKKPRCSEDSPDWGINTSTIYSWGCLGRSNYTPDLHEFSLRKDYTQPDTHKSQQHWYTNDNTDKLMQGISQASRQLQFYSFQVKRWTLLSSLFQSIKCIF